MTYLVIDTLTKQGFPAADLHDVEEAISYITQGEELSDREVDEVSEILQELREGYPQTVGYLTGVQVISND